MEFLIGLICLLFAALIIVASRKRAQNNRHMYAMLNTQVDLKNACEIGDGWKAKYEEVCRKFENYKHDTEVTLNNLQDLANDRLKSLNQASLEINTLKQTTEELKTKVNDAIQASEKKVAKKPTSRVPKKDKLDNAQ